MPLIFSLISVLVVSLISFVGVISLALKPKGLKKITIYLVSLSAGTLLGDSLLHLLPESIEENFNLEFVWLALLAGIIAFFILEKIVCWRHCHIPTSDEHPHQLGIMNLVGDGLHNFLDGVVIIGSFLVSLELGVATTIAVIAHEIPQEISDFGVLVHAGYNRSKAVFLNFLIALTAFGGVFLGFFLYNQVKDFIDLIIPFTAGGFIYIATADLIPELKKDMRPASSLQQLGFILLGITIMFLLKIFM